MSAGAVDVRGVLREYARDTGPFRVTKQGATNLAAACAAVAELIEAAAAVEKLATRHDGDDRMFDRLQAALARVGGAA